MATLRTSIAQRASKLASAAKARTTGHTSAHGTRPARAPHHPGHPTSDLSHLIPELGSRATAERILTYARGLIIGAIRDEFVREGLDYIDLPESWTRHDLRESNLAQNPDYLRFCEITLDSLNLRRDQVPAESDLAFELEDAASADLFGPTLEAAGSTTVFLVARAQVLQQRDAAHARADLNAALDALHRDADTQLKKMVTVPQELRQAVQRRLAMEKASAAGSSDEGSEREDFARHNREEAGQKISMQDLLTYAGKAQEFMQTKQGQQMVALGMTAFALGKNYLKKRKS